jgi:hypothetical protein
LLLIPVYVLVWVMVVSNGYYDIIATVAVIVVKCVVGVQAVLPPAPVAAAAPSLAPSAAAKIAVRPPQAEQKAPLRSSPVPASKAAAPPFRNVSAVCSCSCSCSCCFWLYFSLILLVIVDVFGYIAYEYCSNDYCCYW